MARHRDKKTGLRARQEAADPNRCGNAGDAPKARTLYPDSTLLLCEITWNDDLWVSDGDEVIGIADSFAKAHATRRWGQCGRDRNSRRAAVCRSGGAA